MEALHTASLEAQIIAALRRNLLYEAVEGGARYQQIYGSLEAPYLLQR